MTVLATLCVDGVEVARYVDGSSVNDPRLSPRPFLHPVRTLGGTEVTDYMPDDHPWHLGLSVAIQDVGGVNLWGGRTYVRDHGYVWRDDHGVQRHHSWQHRASDRCAEELGWYAPDGRCLLEEERSLQATPSDVAGQPAWMLTIGFRLRNVSGAPLALGSPATNGRAGAGYGGLFWRLPRSTTAPQVFTASAVGEAAVHGSLAPWLAWVAEIGQPARTFTIAVACGSPAQRTRPDPWFVRVESYPGLCSALAFDQPAVLAADDVLIRHFQALIADIGLDRSSISAWLDSLPPA